MTDAARLSTHDTLKTADVELAMYLFGLWTSARAPEAVLKSAASVVCADSVSVAEPKHKQAAEPSSPPLQAGEHKSEPLSQSQPPDAQALPKYFTERCQRFGLFYHAQFPAQLSAVEAEYDEAGENVQTRMQRERSARNVRFCSLHCSDRCSLFVCSLGACFGCFAVTSLYAVWCKSNGWRPASTTRSALTPVCSMIFIVALRMQTRKTPRSL